MADAVSNEPIDTSVAVDTDDLDAFNALFHGGVPAKVEEAPAEDEDAPEAPVEEEPDQDDTPAEDDEPEEPEAEPESDEDEEEEKPRKKSPQDRINEVTRKFRETERKLEEAMRRIDEISKREEKAPEPTQVTTEGPDPDATLEDGALKYPLGEFDPAYIRDLTRFTIRKENELEKAEQARESQNKEMEAARAALQSGWEDKLEKAEENIPDIRDKAANLVDTFGNLDPTYGDYLAATIMSMECGPEVLSHLSENLSEARRIVQLGPTGATLALGRLEAKFAVKAEEPPKPRQSKAPAPPPTPTRGSGGKFSVQADTDDLDAFSGVFFNKK